MKLNLRKSSVYVERILESPNPKTIFSKRLRTVTNIKYYLINGVFYKTSIRILIQNKVRPSELMLGLQVVALPCAKPTVRIGLNRCLLGFVTSGFIYNLCKSLVYILAALMRKSDPVYP